jgi:hypothetical protein
VPQLKLFSLLPRRPDISEEQFHNHWSTVHRDHALRIKSLRRYVQLHRTQESLPGFPPSIFDGVPEVWLDDLATAAGLGKDPDFTEYAGKDEPNFIDMVRRDGLITTEGMRLPGPPIHRDTKLVKGLILLGKRGDVTREDFALWWHEGFGTLVLDAVPNLVRYVQCLPLPEAYPENQQSYDGVAELWWTDDESIGKASEGLIALAGSLQDTPATLDRTASLVGRELRVIWPEG